MTTAQNSPPESRRIFYGWWMVIAAFLNLFFTVGIVYYGFPRLYGSLIQSLGFARTQVPRGLFFGFLAVWPFAGLLGGMVDRLGTRRVIRFGILLVGLPLILMGWMSKLWQYYALCMAEVVGYALAGPISNQVLISNWFTARRGRAMGYAYLGLGFGGAAAAPLFNSLIERFGWRHAVGIVGAGILVVLLPVAQWVTRSRPEEMGLAADGEPSLTPLLGMKGTKGWLPPRAADGGIHHPLAPSSNEEGGHAKARARPIPEGWTLRAAMQTANFWLLLAGTTLTLFTIGTVSQHWILFLTDLGYSGSTASNLSSIMVASSLVGRVVVGYVADRYAKKNVMALFYLLLSAAVPLLLLAREPSAAWGFAAVFGFTMGADYMLIPLVTAECFGLKTLGRLLTFIILTYSIAQFFGPTLAGKIYDLRGSYTLAWALNAAAGIAGAGLIYLIKPERN